MNKRTLDYQPWKLQKLANPKFAADYLNEAAKDSPAMLLTALKNVAQAREVTSVAKEAGIARENLYRAFSAQGNPTYDTLNSVLTVLGLRLAVVTAMGSGSSPAPIEPMPGRAELGVAQPKQNPTACAGISPETIGFGPRLAYINPNPVRLGGGVVLSPQPMRDKKWRTLRSVSNG